MSGDVPGKRIKHPKIRLSRKAAYPIFNPGDTKDTYVKKGNWYWSCGDHKGKHRIDRLKTNHAAHRGKRGSANTSTNQQKNTRREKGGQRTNGLWAEKVVKQPSEI